MRKRAGKILFAPLLLLMLCSMCVSTAQAAKPEKLVEHEVYEGTFDGMWCKAVMHGTMIVKGMIGDNIDVKVTMLQKIVLYEYEGGPIIAVLKLTLHYVGTVTTLDGGEDPTEAFYTGKMVADVVLNEIQEGLLPENKPEDAHYVVWYEAGVAVKGRGFGPLPWD
jgi:hypothetical protein